MSRPTVPARPDLNDSLADELAKAISLHQSGRIGEARSIYYRLTMLDAGNARAHQLLGVACLQQGDAGAAVSYLEKAAEIEPGHAECLCDLGAALNAASRFEEAIRALNRAIDLRPDFANAYSNLGMALKNLHRSEPAARALREAIRLRPTEAGYHHNLGNALTELGDLHEAEQAYRAALRLKPGHPGAVTGLALTLSELGRTGEAISLGLQAIEKRQNVAAYHSALGRAYKDAGKPQKAVASYRRAHAIDRHDMSSVRNIALLERKNSFDQEMRDFLDLYHRGGLAAEQEMHLAYALGTWFDDLGDFERGFEFYERANRIRRGDRNFEFEEVRDSFAEIKRVYEFLDTPARSLSETENPIFIVGLPRAGKTTLEGMLARHQSVRSAGELRIMSLLSRELAERFQLSTTGARISSLPSDALCHIKDEYLRHVRRIVPAPFVPVDTMPPNFRLVGLISQAMPNARVINVLRSPIEHCAAIFKKCFGRDGYAYSEDLEETANYYLMYRDMMAYWREKLPGYVLDVDVSDIYRAPEATMRRVLEHCGLDFDDGCLEFFQSEPRIGDDNGLSFAGEEARLAPYRRVIDPMLQALESSRRSERH